MFISEVFAANTSSNVSISVASFIPLILIFVVFYFLIIRPNHKKLKERRRMIDQIKLGDMVVTSSGIIGEVSKIDEVNSLLMLEIAPKIEIKILKSTISEILNKEIQKEVARSIEKNKLEKNGKKNKLEKNKKEESAS